jgi:hypothetical protein
MSVKTLLENNRPAFQSSEMNKLKSHSIILSFEELNFCQQQGLYIAELKFKFEEEVKDCAR